MLELQIEKLFLIVNMVIGIQVWVFYLSTNKYFDIFYLGGAESLGGMASTGAAHKIGKQITVLQEENNMLKLKVDVLLTLVAESIAELSSSQK